MNVRPTHNVQQNFKQTLIVTAQAYVCKYKNEFEKYIMLNMCLTTGLYYVNDVDINANESNVRRITSIDLDLYRQTL